MTLERKIVVGLEDIDSISLECNECKGKITFGADKRISIPQKCPGCGHTWIPEGIPPFNSHEHPLGIFLKTVEVIRTLSRSKAVGVRVLLEYKESS